MYFKAGHEGIQKDTTFGENFKTPLLDRRGGFRE